MHQLTLREQVLAKEREALLETMTGSLAFVWDDGGRAAAGFKGNTGDCTVRAIAIAAEIPYIDVYNALNELGKRFPRKGKHQYARNGVSRKVYDHYLRDVLGWIWVPTMKIGSGCQVHLNRDDLPDGRLICRVSKHHCAVINGVIHDLSDPSRGGTRCVYGYWHG